jgi:dihydrofolate reductase
VLTHGDQKLDWANSHRLRSIDELKKVTAGEGPDIVLWGSSTLYPQLLEANLIDGLNLLIYPILLGKGKKLFGGASHPVTMRLPGRTARRQLPTIPTRKPRSNSAAFSSMRRGT